MDKDLIYKRIGENRADLYSFEKQLRGIEKTTLSKERLEELIQTKKDNISRLKRQLNM